MMDIDDPENRRRFVEFMKGPLPFLQHQSDVPRATPRAPPLRESVTARHGLESPVDQMAMGTILPSRTSDEEKAKASETGKQVRPKTESGRIDTAVTDDLKSLDDGAFELDFKSTLSANTKTSTKDSNERDEQSYSRDILPPAARSFTNNHTKSRSSGVEAPPPTPEARAHIPANSYGNEYTDSDVIGIEIGNLLAKGSYPGLAGSIHAPRDRHYALDKEAKQSLSTPAEVSKQSKLGLQSASIQPKTASERSSQTQEFATRPSLKLQIPEFGQVPNSSAESPLFLDTSTSTGNSAQSPTDTENYDLISAADLESNADSFVNLHHSDSFVNLHHSDAMAAEASEQKLPEPKPNTAGTKDLEAPQHKLLKYGTKDVENLIQTLADFNATAPREKYAKLKGAVDKAKGGVSMLSSVVKKGKENLAVFMSDFNDPESYLGSPEPESQLVDGRFDSFANEVSPEDAKVEHRLAKPETSVTSVIGQGITYVKESVVGKAHCVEELSPTKTQSEKLTEKIVPQFEKWPAVEKRGGNAARTRTVKLTNLPLAKTPKLVASLVHGGALEKIVLSVSNTAFVSFLNADDCKKYYNSTGNGVIHGYAEDGKKLVAFVYLAEEVDIVGGMLKAMIERGATRCVAAVGYDTETNAQDLLKLPQFSRFKFENVHQVTDAKKCKRISFRLCSIQDAVTFHGALSRNEDWEAFNIFYAPDPCALDEGDKNRIAQFRV